MKNNNVLQRIIVDPDIMVGKPVIQGTRLTVEFILGLLGQGLTTEKLLEEYPRLKKEDIFACLLFAQKAISDVTFIPPFQHKAK